MQLDNTLRRKKAVVTYGGTMSSKSRDENRAKSQYQKFVDHTTIHGVRDMYYATPKFVKFVWLAIVVICITGAAYQITVMAITYRHQPTTSHIIWAQHPYYLLPPVTFCPSKWMNFQKAKNLGLSNYTMFALKMAAYGLDGWGSKPEFLGVAENLDRVLLNVSVDLITLYHDISHDVKHFFQCRQCSTVDKIFQQMNGVCYKFRFPKLNSKRLTVASFFSLHFSYDDPHEFLPPEYAAFIAEPPKIAVGEAAVSSIAFDSARLKLNRTYQLKLHVKRIIKLNRPKDPCRSKSENITFSFASVDACALNCSGYLSGPYYHFCLMCTNISHVMGNSWRDQLKSVNHPCKTPLWQGAKNDSEQCNVIRNFTFENCSNSAECHPPNCDFKLYDYSIMVLADNKPNTTVHIFYRPIEGIETVQEIYTYSWETFLSNIGGQLGLWLGASVVSFFQIVYYFCHYCCRKNEIRRALTKRNSSKRAFI